MLPVSDATVGPTIIQQLLGKMRNFVTLKPPSDPFDAGLIDEALAERIFPLPGTEYDRYTQLKRYTARGGQTSMMGMEFTQYRYRLKIDDLTSKVIVLAQIKIKSREQGAEVAVVVVCPCWNNHVVMIPTQHLRGNGAFQRQGEWLVCPQKPKKGAKETLENFWKRCRESGEIVLRRMYDTEWSKQVRV